MTPPSTSHDHYAVLGLPNPICGRHITPQDIKQAYRRALLQHHPDRSNDVKPPCTSRLPSSVGAKNLTVDDILLAYKVLSDSRARKEYDCGLRLKQQSPQTKFASVSPQTGLETVDLDEFDFDDTHEFWYHGCRCGDEMGFVVREEDLDGEGELQEVVTGCNGCSLWLRVQYQIAYKD
ncbi:MAG: hypothetical protein M1830_010306 [Pleopsidium flavum]|nr:MAG: hypothetical protein M1830_010306 [Pleopsidium flavum]